MEIVPAPGKKSQKNVASIWLATLQKPGGCDCGHRGAGRPSNCARFARRAPTLGPCRVPGGGVPPAWLEALARIAWNSAFRARLLEPVSSNGVRPRTAVVNFDHSLEHNLGTSQGHFQLVPVAELGPDFQLWVSILEHEEQRRSGHDDRDNGFGDTPNQGRVEFNGGHPSIMNWPGTKAGHDVKPLFGELGRWERVEREPAGVFLGGGDAIPLRTETYRARDERRRLESWNLGDAFATTH